MPEASPIPCESGEGRWAYGYLTAIIGAVAITLLWAATGRLVVL